MREKRQHPRAILVTEVQVRLGAEETYIYVGESRDISIGGMFLSGSAPAAMGTKVLVSFDLPHMGPTEVPAFIRWVKGGGFGLQFGLIGPRETHAIGRLIREHNEKQAS